MDKKNRSDLMYHAFVSSILFCVGIAYSIFIGLDPIKSQGVINFGFAFLSDPLIKLGNIFFTKSPIVCGISILLVRSAIYHGMLTIDMSIKDYVEKEYVKNISCHIVKMISEIMVLVFAIFAITSHIASVL